MREEGPLHKALGMLNESSLYLKNLDPPFHGDTGHRTVVKMAAPSHSPDMAASAPTASHSENGEDGKCPSSATGWHSAKTMKPVKRAPVIKGLRGRKGEGLEHRGFLRHRNHSM